MIAAKERAAEAEALKNLEKATEEKLKAEKAAAAQAKKDSDFAAKVNTARQRLDKFMMEIAKT